MLVTDVGESTMVTTLRCLLVTDSACWKSHSQTDYATEWLWRTFHVWVLIKFKTSAFSRVFRRSRPLERFLRNSKNKINEIWLQNKQFQIWKPYYIQILNNIIHIILPIFGLILDECQRSWDLRDYRISATEPLIIKPF